jgi:hypothetical protein
MILCITLAGMDEDWIWFKTYAALCGEILLCIVDYDTSGVFYWFWRYTPHLL